MRIGIIGLGDIAKKAYLPVLAEQEGIELVLCTRNADTLSRLAAKYRIKEKVQTVKELIETGIEAAFVSTATSGHFTITKQLLESGIHVYIDKPISMDFQETKEIVELAKQKGVIAMVGFNRRFIPHVKRLKENGKANLIIMQKNRFNAPDYARRFVVEDFIHVVDTLRFLMGSEVQDVKVDYLQQDDLLQYLTITLVGKDCTAIGIMNRNTGVTEEVIEYMTTRDKYVVHSLVETTHYHDKKITISKFGDWEPTLYKRGFYQMVEHFIDCVKNMKTPSPSISDSFISHEICERILSFIEEKEKRLSEESFA